MCICQVRLDLVLNVSKSGSTRLTKQDLIKVKIKPRQFTVQVGWFNKSLLEIKISQIEVSPFQHTRVAKRNRGGKATTIWSLGSIVQKTK
jgi:hypothetical protein